MSRASKKKMPRKKKFKALLAKESNDKVHNRLLKSLHGQSSCKICPPYKGENSIGKPNGKYGKTKRKYKDKRR